MNNLQDDELNTALHKAAKAFEEFMSKLSAKHNDGKGWAEGTDPHIYALNKAVEYMQKEHPNIGPIFAENISDLQKRQFAKCILYAQLFNSTFAENSI